MLSHYRTRLMAPVLTALAAVCAPAYAAVVPDATHFHFSAKEQELTVRLSNQGGSPALVQAWIDDGDADSTPETAAAVPFVIRPPVARINAGAEKVLRIVAAGAPAASDRETMYFFNLLDVPATTQGADAVLNLIVRSRFSLTYRPEGLTAAGAIKAAEQLRWSLARDGQGWTLHAENPTPYYVHLGGFGDKERIFSASRVAPFSSATYRLSHAQQAALGTQVTYQFRNEQGGLRSLTAPLQRP